MRSIVMVLLVVLFADCQKDPEILQPELPKVKLIGVSDITSTSALFEAEVTDLGNLECLHAKGFCLSIAPNDQNCPDPIEYYGILLKNGW